LTAGLVLSFSMPYREITLGPAYSIRLQDLAASDVVNVTCATCRATWLVPQHRLFAKYNGYTGSVAKFQLEEENALLQQV